MTTPEQHAANKKAVVSALRDVIHCAPGDLGAAVNSAYQDDAKLFAFHPVNEAEGAEGIATSLWQPIRTALPDAERRERIVIAGGSKDRDYVCIYSELQGTFEESLFDIPASHDVVSLRCCEINRIQDGRIARTHILIDMLDLMHQAGCWPISFSGFALIRRGTT